MIYSKNKIKIKIMVYLLCRYRSYKNSENTNLICITIKNLQRYLNYISTTTVFSMKNIKFSLLICRKCLLFSIAQNTSFSF